MEFRDKEMDELNLEKPKDMIKCINLLCDQTPSQDDLKLLAKMIDKAKDEGIGYEQFNELLLLLNQVRIEEGFFLFFFKPQNGKITLEMLKKGVTKFRGYAMLCYVNFRHAYKKWIGMTETDIDKDVKEQCCLLTEFTIVFDSRSDKVIDIELIPKDKLWYLGYISQEEIKKDVLNCFAILYKIDKNLLKWDKFSEETQDNIVKIANSFNKSQIERWTPKINQIIKALNKNQNEIERIRKIALNNMTIYLTWDHMDIYVATSMREKWEFEDTFEFVKKVFEHPDIAKFKLRYFNPTQSWVEDRIQKGLVEGLMLKRAKFTLYLAQETDSLGKDSELAITLAQGKPVIAYIPSINVTTHAQKISEYPLNFFRKRISLLEAEDIFPECKPEIESNLGQGTYDKIKDFRDKLGKHFSKRTFNIDLEEEMEFKNKNSSLFNIICNVLAIAERSYFDKRADLLRRVHPLGLQVDLRTGVANGVLVVRTAEQCIELLKRIILDSMKFTITNEQNGFFLNEESTGSCYRVITKNEKITNSFWNFYLS